MNKDAKVFYDEICNYYYVGYSKNNIIHYGFSSYDEANNWACANSYNIVN